MRRGYPAPQGRRRPRGLDGGPRCPAHPQVPRGRRDGYRAHVAADPGTGIITGEKLTKAAGQENSDPAVAAEFLAAEAAADGATPSASSGSGSGNGGGSDLLAWYGDSAYGTGDLRGAIEKAGHQAVIKPKPLRAPVEGGFTVDDFTVHQEQGTVTCPAGNTVALSRTRVATFGALCRDCPLRAQCTTCKSAMTCCAPPAATGPPPGCARTTWPTGPTWNAPSPRSPPGGDASSSSATAEGPRTTPGSSAAPPR